MVDIQSSTFYAGKYEDRSGTSRKADLISTDFGGLVRQLDEEQCGSRAREKIDKTP